MNGCVCVSVSASERHLYSKLRKLQRCINNHHDHNNKTANREKNEAGQIKVAKKTSCGVVYNNGRVEHTTLNHTLPTTPPRNRKVWSTFNEQLTSSLSLSLPSPRVAPRLLAVTNLSSAASKLVYKVDGPLNL